MQFTEIHRTCEITRTRSGGSWTWWREKDVWDTEFLAMMSNCSWRAAKFSGKSDGVVNVLLLLLLLSFMCLCVQMSSSQAGKKGAKGWFMKRWCGSERSSSIWKTRGTVTFGGRRERERERGGRSWVLTTIAHTVPFYWKEQCWSGRYLVWTHMCAAAGGYSVMIQSVRLICLLVTQKVSVQWNHFFDWWVFLCCMFVKSEIGWANALSIYTCIMFF